MFHHLHMQLLAGDMNLLPEQQALLSLCCQNAVRHVSKGAALAEGALYMRMCACGPLYTVCCQCVGPLFTQGFGKV
jgi:hypothetical protein